MKYVNFEAQQIKYLYDYLYDSEVWSRGISNTKV